MIRSIISMIAEVVRWYFSPEHAEAQRRERNADTRKAVYKGDEDKVNARITDLIALTVGSVVCATFLGCLESTVYVSERDRVKALQIGEVYTNESQAVEWVVPPAILTQLLKEEK